MIKLKDLLNEIQIKQTPKGLQMYNNLKVGDVISFFDISKIVTVDGNNDIALNSERTQGQIIKKSKMKSALNHEIIEYIIDIEPEYRLIYTDGEHLEGNEYINPLLQQEFLTIKKEMNEIQVAKPTKYRINEKLKHRDGDIGIVKEIGKYKHAKASRYWTYGNTDFTGSENENWYLIYFPSDEMKFWCIETTLDKQYARVVNEIQITKTRPPFPHKYVHNIEKLKEESFLQKYKLTEKDAADLQKYFIELDEPDFVGVDLRGQTILQAIKDNTLFDDNFTNENLQHIITALWPDVVFLEDIAEIQVFKKSKLKIEGDNMVDVPGFLGNKYSNNNFDIPFGHEGLNSVGFKQCSDRLKLLRVPYTIEKDKYDNYSILIQSKFIEYL